MSNDKCGSLTPIEFFTGTKTSKSTLLYLLELLSTNDLYGKWHKTDFESKRGPKLKDGYSTVSKWIKQESFSNSIGTKFCYYGSTSKDETNLCLRFSNFVNVFQENHFNEQEM